MKKLLFIIIVVLFYSCEKEEIITEYQFNNLVSNTYRINGIDTLIQGSSWSQNLYTIEILNGNKIFPTTEYLKGIIDHYDNNEITISDTTVILKLTSRNIYEELIFFN